METNQIHVLAAAMPGYVKQAVDTVESRFAGEIVRDVIEVDWHDRIDDDLSLVRWIAPANFDVGSRPDTDAAGDSPAPNAFAEVFRKNHSGDIIASLGRTMARVIVILLASIQLSAVQGTQTFTGTFHLC